MGDYDKKYESLKKRVNTIRYTGFGRNHYRTTGRYKDVAKRVRTSKYKLRKNVSRYFKNRGGKK